jgi:hypothetical protein
MHCGGGIRPDGKLTRTQTCADVARRTSAGRHRFNWPRRRLYAVTGSGWVNGTGTRRTEGTIKRPRDNGARVRGFEVLNTSRDVATLAHDCCGRKSRGVRMQDDPPWDPAHTSRKLFLEPFVHPCRDETNRRALEKPSGTRTNWRAPTVCSSSMCFSDTVQMIS